MNIALLGCGVVGSGVLALTEARQDLSVTKILLRRQRPELSDRAVFSMEDILADPSVELVAEVMGGVEPAFTYVSAALKAGKHVVTANKALIAAKGPELLALAKEHGAALRCTAAVGGGIPWLVNLERCKRLDEIEEVGGIMNGTSNFIMDAMHRQGADFGETLRLAQQLGYAEADPAADIDGGDIRRKLAISAAVAFDAAVEETAIPMFGIRNVTAADVAAFRAHGFTCKLLATAVRADDGIAAWIEPTLLGADDLEAAVPANFNLISYTADRIGRQSYFGQGAGSLPTAGNVVQDCLDILGGVRDFYGTPAAPAAMAHDAVAHPYYVRTACPDGWLEEHTAERWESGVVTCAVGVDTMLDWAARQLAADGHTFIAGIR